MSDLNKNYHKIEKNIKLFLLPKDEADKKNAIIEIRAGTGGLEASLFAGDLFKMYEKVSNKKMKKFFNYKLKFPSYIEGLNHIQKNLI